MPLSQIINTDDAHYQKQSFSLSKTNNLANNTNNAKDKKKQNVMIIATYPKSEVRLLAIWSQLECFTSGYDKIIISAPNEDWSRNALQNFTFQVMIHLPEIHKILEVQYYKNDRYDAGLWCDSLHSLQTNNNMLSWSFDNYFLINDSLLALRKFNDFLTVLEENRNTSLVSLNWWEQNSTYWVESGARSFSLNGIQTYYSNICQSLTRIKKDCDSFKRGFMKVNYIRVEKWCLVKGIEVNVSSYYNRNELYGLYPGEIPPEHLSENNHKMWATNYNYWRDVLVGKLNFPVMKISGILLEIADKTVETNNLRSCTTKYIHYSI